MGDFNADMYDVSNSETTKVNQFLQIMSLTQVVNEHTRFTAESKSLIDIVCTNCNVRDVLVTNITGSINGHSMINVTMSLKKVKISPKVVTCRPLKDIVLDNFNEDLYNVDWEYIGSLASVEAMVTEFNSRIIELFDRHTPVRTIRIRPLKSLLWITDTLRFIIQLREEAHARYRKTKLDAHKNYYKDLKLLVTQGFYSER